MRERFLALILFIGFLFSCKSDVPKVSVPDYYVFDSNSDLEKFQNLYEQFVNLDVKIDSAHQPHINIEFWKYGIGSSAIENGFVPPNLDSIVYLPHRILKPNRSLWYSHSYQSYKQMVLYLDADDGAQVWYGSERCPALFGNYYKIKASATEKLITVRVLNNAMKGGLKKAFLIDEKQFDQISKFQLVKPELKISLLNLLSPHKAKGILPLISDSQADFSPISFSFWGDSQGGWSTFARICRQLNDPKDEFTIGLGDLVGNGIDKDQWLDFTHLLSGVNKPAVLIAGNHDYDGFYDRFVPVNLLNLPSYQINKKTYFSFLKNGCFFMVLDPNRNFPLAIDEEQSKWMNEQLNSNQCKSAKWRFILMHQPPYGQGWEGYYGDDFARKLIDQIAEKHKIDFVLSGHIHDYERLTKTYGAQKTHFIISGGAGGGLEDTPNSVCPLMDTIIKQHHFCRLSLSEEQAILMVLGTDGVMIDKVIFKK